MKYFVFILLSVFYIGASELPFDQVVIWGHKLHSHTHSYIHERFYRAFKHLGYTVYWFDHKDAVSDFDFSRTLFITEGQVDNRIPLREDCLYILHNCQGKKYESLFEKGCCINLQVYTDDVLSAPNAVKIDTCIYYDIPGKCVYMPWASDLLPHEIEEMKQRLPHIKKDRRIYWIGTAGSGTFGNIEQLNPFARACKENNVQFRINDSWAKALNRDDLLERTAKNFLAPTIVGKWQAEKGYIPCRIFINISSGQMGITNSPRVYELFDRKIVYNPDTYQLFYDAMGRLSTWSQEEQYALMDFIKTKHTYINRIQTLLDFFQKVRGDRLSSD